MLYTLIRFVPLLARISLLVTAKNATPPALLFYLKDIEQWCVLRSLHRTKGGLLVPNLWAKQSRNTRVLPAVRMELNCNISASKFLYQYLFLSKAVSIASLQ